MVVSWCIVAFMRCDIGNNSNVYRLACQVIYNGYRTYNRGIISRDLAWA